MSVLRKTYLTGQRVGQSGGLGALKIGLIALAAMAAVGLGAFVATQIVSGSAEPQEASTIEDVVGQEKPEASEESAPIDQEELEALEESTPIDRALEQYRTIISQADSYEYGEYAETDRPWLEFVGYRYALVQMQKDDPVPTLLLEWEVKDTEISVTNSYARVFQYDPDTETVRQPTEVIADGGIRGGLSMAGDGDGIMSISWSGGTGETFVSRITLDGDSLNRDTYWTGLLVRIPHIAIEWHEIGDLSALDSWTPTKNENTDLLVGYVGTYTPYESYNDWYGGGEELRDITLTESGIVTGGGTSYSAIDINGLEPSEILQNEDGSIEITFSVSGCIAFYTVYPAGVVPDGYSTDYSADVWQRELDLSKAHIRYIYIQYNDSGAGMEILYHN